MTRTKDRGEQMTEHSLRTEAVECPKVQML